jgi:hypothetical protein
MYIINQHSCAPLDKHYNLDISEIETRILPRRTWRYSNNTDAMERTRKRLNRGLRTYLLQNNSYAIAYPDLYGNDI